MYMYICWASTVNVDDDDAEECRHRNGSSVERHGAEHVLQVGALVDDVKKMD